MLHQDRAARQLSLTNVVQEARAISQHIGALADSPQLGFTTFSYPGVQQSMAVVLLRPFGEEAVYQLRYDQGVDSMTGVLPLNVGDRYLLEVAGRRIADPYSKYQPAGAVGPSEVVDGQYAWREHAPLAEEAPRNVFEIHVGTFAGTFASTAEKLSYIKDLGYDAVQLMPVQECVGSRNWGYDPTHIYAPYSAYGTPNDLKYLIDEAHARGLRAIIDVVYNHIGPEANEIAAVIPEFYGNVSTPWGKAINFESRAVREFFLQNATYWIEEFRADGLRLDAAHEIRDDGSDPHLLEELTSRVRRINPHAFIVAEHEGTLPREWGTTQQGGFGLSAKYDDRIGLALRAHFGGKKDGYYSKYSDLNAPKLAALLSTVRDMSYLTWEHHDWRGNEVPFRALELSIPVDAWRTALALLAFSPGTMFTFQGQEYGGENFGYFRQALDPKMEDAIRTGRTDEFKSFVANPSDVPDPFAEQTFIDSQHHAEKALTGTGAESVSFFEQLFALRNTPALLAPKKNFEATAYGDDILIMVRRPTETDDFAMSVLVANVGKNSVEIDLKKAFGRCDFANWKVELSTPEGASQSGTVIRSQNAKVGFSGTGAVIFSTAER